MHEEILAKWREAGEWWAGESAREITIVRDAKGRRREKVIELSAFSHEKSKSPKTYVENNRDEYNLRPRKLRDEKVSIACGFTVPQPTIRRTAAPSPYVPLHTMSGYAFGRSILFAEEIARIAATYRCPACAIVDPFSLVGAVEFAHEAKRVGVKPLIGASFELEEGGVIVLIARDKYGYVSLSQLISACHIDEPRLFPICNWQRLKRFSRGLICLTGGHDGYLNRLLSRRKNDEAFEFLCHLRSLYGSENVFVEIERSFTPWEVPVNHRLRQLAETTACIAVAGGAVTHQRPEHFPAQDAVTCAETLCLVDEVIGRKPQRHETQRQVEASPIRAINGERYFRSSIEFAELFADCPELVANTHRVAERCDDDVLPSRTRLPSLANDPNKLLYEATYAGAAQRHTDISKGLRSRLELELERITRLDFAAHFLVMWDVCRWAKSQDIHYSGRGSVVDSAVAYCLGLSRIDAWKHNLHFDRFLTDDGNKRPDIDMDFEAKRREDVRNYLTHKYGRENVATVAAVGAYFTRGIVREVGKALGLQKETIDFLSKRIHGGVPPEQLENALANRPELIQSPISRERFRWVFRLAEMLTDVPRNIRAHSSGVVISSNPISETVPVMLSASEVDDEHFLRIIQWDKRSAKYYFDKFDILCLRGQDVLSGAQRRIRANTADFDVRDLTTDDPETYRAMRSGELVGIPQSASPAMRQAHIRMRTENLHDASLVQAGIRPGVGGAVKINTLIRRRRGLEQCVYEHPALERILGITYGIVVFQEQVDQLLQTFCGYTSDEAENIRDKIHKRRREDYGQLIKKELVARIAAHGCSPEVSEHIFELIAGFKGYGFAQGHALAFAEISIRSIFCQQNYPSEYFASILSAQPAGYYGPCTLVNEARLRGVTILPPDVNASDEQFSVEDIVPTSGPALLIPGGAIRVGLMQIAGLSKATRLRILEQKPYVSWFDFVCRVRPDREEMETLTLCGALDSLITNRRALLWAIVPALATARAAVPSLPMENLPPQLDLTMQDFMPEEKAVYERELLGLDVSRHLMSYERARVSARGAISSMQCKTLKPGRKAIVVGNPIRLRFPPTPSGKRVVFLDLEDETGLLNVTCFDAVYRRDGHAIVCSPYVTIIGETQDRDGHSAFLAKRVFAYEPQLLASLDAPPELPQKTADFLVG